MPNEYPNGEPASSPAPPRQLVEDLRRAGLEVAEDTVTRAEHARDWWPLSIPDVAHGRVRRWPGAVVQARSLEDVVATLRVASSHRVAVTAQGGRSGVVGGAAPEDGAIALDLTGLNRVLELDETAQLVRVEAGVLGPELERFVQERGFTVGHFPQSFELATVGGWIACRGAGQYSNRYGKIEDFVRALTVVLADGRVLELGGRAPRQAIGPDLLALFVGSEGTLGVITEATLLVRRRAVQVEEAAYCFDDFDQGMDACRRVLQHDAHPAVLRLYDEVESKRHFEIDGCVLIALDEGEPGFVKATMSVVAKACDLAHRLEESVVERWLERRNDVGALAPLWQRGLVVDTIEVAGSWSILSELRGRVLAATAELEGMIVVSVHQSHAYYDGACLYFTFAGQPPGDALDFYRAAWDAAINEVLALGGAMSHHHGVGRNRARFVEAALGDSMPVLRGLKDLLDPSHLLNPGVLGLGGPVW